MLRGVETGEGETNLARFVSWGALAGAAVETAWVAIGEKAVRLTADIVTGYSPSLQLADALNALYGEPMYVFAGISGMVAGGSIGYLLSRS